MTTKSKTMKYQLLVGNIGTVASTDSENAAMGEYKFYVEASKSLSGRAGGEEVTLFEDGDIILSNSDFSDVIGQGEYESEEEGGEEEDGEEEDGEEEDE